MFTSTAFLEVESSYRREQLRRAWGGPLLMRLRSRRWAAEARRAGAARRTAPAGHVGPATQLVRHGAVAGTGAVAR